MRMTPRPITWGRRPQVSDALGCGDAADVGAGHRLGDLGQLELDSGEVVSVEETGS
jgi:hypothetical protein